MCSTHQSMLRLSESNRSQKRVKLLARKRLCCKCGAYLLASRKTLNIPPYL